MRVPTSVQRAVRTRAKFLCEYCQLPESREGAPHCIDHIVAIKHRGDSTPDNLALSCYYCNSYKLDNLSGVDPASGKVTRLYHPRRDTWEQHFHWLGASLEGKSDVGRATIEVLRINEPIRIEHRRKILELGDLADL